MNVAVKDEYIAPDSTLAFMLNYWHGWWRFMWHWHAESKGIVLPDLRMAWAHRKYCDGSWDKIGFSFTVWRCTVTFNCVSMKKNVAHYREMFADDIWPTVVLDDVLDCEVIDD